MQQEQFGTQIPLYHKFHYNIRGQLYDIRLSTVAWATDQWNWNRGAIIDYYATADLSCQTQGCRFNSGPDNNGSVRQSQYWIPSNDQTTSYNWTEDRYIYDTLNRLKSVTEYPGTTAGGLGAQSFIQTYDYDRYGNRTINQSPSQTSDNVPHPNYTVDTNTNRLIAPAGYNYSYDAAGNQTNDTYTVGGGSRTYDGENHLKQAQGSPNGQWQTYTYDAGGKRIKRNVNGVETWQVYGMGGGLLAEYNSGAAAFLPSREYGYRGGALLVTISSGDDVRLSRFVTNLYYGALQRDPTSQELQDKINQLAAAGVQSQSLLLTKASEIARSLFTQTNYETSPFRTDAQYVADLYYAYLQRGPDDSGLGWWTGQAASSRINVCNAFEASSEFATLVTTLYGTAASDNERTEHFVNNFYLGAYGRNATSTELQTQRDALNVAAAQGLTQVKAQAETFGRSLFATQVNDAGLSNTQFVTNLYEAFLQRGPDAGGLSFWSPQATVGTGRQNVLSQFATCPPFYELAGTLYREAFWLVADHLGTPRMIVNKSGSLAGVKRHDYLPFGEEIGGPQVALLGGRTPAQGYTGDSVRQHFTGYEADGETGLNFAQARYQSPTQGRFTSVDPLGASASVASPQSFNRYTYANNDPANLTDPNGLMAGADQGWSNVAAGFWGSSAGFNDPHFGGPSIIAAADAAYEKNHSDRMEASRINQLIEQGLSKEEAEDLIKGNDNLAITEGPTVKFTTVKVVSPLVASANDQTHETSGSGATGAVTLNLEKELGPGGDKVPQFRIQVNFLVPEGFKLDAQESGVLLRRNSRWDVMGESPIDIQGMQGKVRITMTQRDKEGDATMGSVVIAGSLGKGVSASGSLRIRIVTIAGDLPRDQREKP